MNKFSSLLIVITVVGTILFGALQLIDKKSGYGYVKQIYFLYKFILLFFLIPVFIFALISIHCQTIDSIMFINTPDFQSIRFIEGKNVISLPYSTWFSVVWLFGFFFFQFVHTIKIKRGLKEILKTSTLVDEADILHLKYISSQNLKVRQNIILYKSAMITSPFTTGIVHKKIILPERYLEKSEWGMLIAHEMIHCKRWDVLFRGMIRLVQNIHWFNPAMSLFLKRFYELSEYSCDLEVIKNFDKNQRVKYGNLMILLLDNEVKREVVAGFSERDMMFIKRRLINIMKLKRKKGHLMLAVIPLFLAICPILTYAATSGISLLENSLIFQYQNHKESAYSTAAIIEGNLIEDVVVDNAIKTIELGSLNGRGSNTVNVSLEPKGNAEFSPLKLNKGASIRFFLSADNASDLFSVSVGNKGVNSAQGAMNSTIAIDEQGTYTIYIRNKSAKTIHISGTIYVNY